MKRGRAILDVTVRSIALTYRHCGPKRGDVTRIGISSGIYAAQIQSQYQHTPMVLSVNVVNSALVAIVLASYMGQMQWLVFLALTVALTVARTIGWACYRRHVKRSHSMT